MASKLPSAEPVSSLRELVSRKETVPPVKARAPMKSLALLLSVISPPMALTFDVPVTERAPVWVMAPVAIRARLPPTLEPAISSAVVSVTLASALPVIPTEPSKKLLLVRAMLPFPVRLVSPMTFRLPI